MVLLYTVTNSVHCWTLDLILATLVVREACASYARAFVYVTYEGVTFVYASRNLLFHVECAFFA